MGARGFFIDQEIIRLPPGEPVDIRDDLWERLEREPAVAQMMAEGELRPA